MDASFGVNNQTIGYRKIQCHPVNFSTTHLSHSNFENSRLPESDFSRAELNHANFAYSNLNQSNLHDLSAIKANFKRTNLTEVDFSYSYLPEGNLRFCIAIQADFTRSRLQGANLSGASLSQAILEDVQWTDKDGSNPTILPDGLAWTTNTDMEKFTNPEHPDFNSTLEKINAIRSEAGIDPLK